MKHFKSIDDYCQAICIPAPKHPYFDIRSFEENMPTVVAQMPSFKHEFYAIAIKIEGGGTVTSGVHQQLPKGASVFFNTPFQVLSWDIIPDWQGYYLMFTKEFIAQSQYLQSLLHEFPFLKIDTSQPFKVFPHEIQRLLHIYEGIHREYQYLQPDSLRIIESQVLVLLNYVKRYFTRQFDAREAQNAIRKADINLLSRFQHLLEAAFYKESLSDQKTHSPSFYADQLAVHTNHLNAILKQITGKTTKNHIHLHLLGLAKSKLIHSNLSIKEIAYELHFESPNRFSSFFKKMTDTTPNKYRKQQVL